jgi:hypothetical protein
MRDSASSTSGDRRSRTSTASSPRSFWIIPILVVLGAMDLFTLAKNHTEAEDSAFYIMDVTNGENLFHPNHLLFSGINSLHYRFWTACGYSGDATVPMQLISVAASLASVYLVHRIAIRVGATPLMALAAAGWTAFSFGFWVYSLEADTYLAPLPFVLLSILLLFGVRPTDWRALTTTSVARLIALGTLNAIGALLHQQYLFMVPIVGLSLILTWRMTSARTLSSLITTEGIYCVTAVSLIAVTYISVGKFALGHNSIFETIAWARGHASNGMWESFSPKSVLLLVVGFGRALFAINFLFGSPGMANVIAKVFPNKSLLEERYLAEHYIGTMSFFLIVGAMLVAFAAIAWLAFRLMHGVAAVVDTCSPRWIFTRVAVIYLGSYVLLILIWEPSNPEFWIALMPVLAILVACRLDSQKAVVPAAFALVAALFVANFVGAVWPYARTDSDYWTTENEGFVKIARKGDVIVTECAYVCLNNLALGTGVRPIEASSDDAEVLASALASPATGRVFVSSWAFDPPDGAANSGGGGKVRAMLVGVRYRLVEIGRSGSQVIWQIAPNV